MTTLINRYCRVLEFLMVVALAAMVVLVFGNVVLRYVFDSGISVSEEVSRWLFVWLVFLGAVVALRDRAHLGVDMVVQRLPRSGQKACLLGGQLAMLYVLWLLCEGCIAQARINLHVTAPSTGASVAIFYASGGVFAASAFVILLRDAWRVVTGRLAEDEYVMVTESEELHALQAKGNPAP